MSLRFLSFLLSLNKVTVIILMISIILPVYNGEKYIEDAIKSVMSQTYNNWELIVIDDGSSDSTSTIVNKYINTNIHYIYQENKGPSDARNKGITVAKGEYLAFLDADDLYKSNKLSDQLSYLNENPSVDIVYNDIEVVDEFLNHLSFLKSEGIYNRKEDFLAVLLFRQIIPLPPSMLIRRRCFEGGLKYNSNYIHCEDYDLTIQLASQYTFGYLPENLYIYRRHDNNLTNQHQKQLDAEKEIIRKMGILKIEQIVNSSSFNLVEKSILLGKILIKAEYYNRAKEIFFELIHNGEGNHIVYFYLGNVLYLLNDFENAKRIYQKAIQYQEDMAEVYNNLGCVYAIEREYCMAQKLFDRALYLRPNYMDSIYNKMQPKETQASYYRITKKELRKTITSYKI